jgi:hypothetical protein
MAEPTMPCGCLLKPLRNLNPAPLLTPLSHENAVQGQATGLDLGSHPASRCSKTMRKFGRPLCSSARTKVHAVVTRTGDRMRIITVDWGHVLRMCSQSADEYRLALGKVFSR